MIAADPTIISVTRPAVIDNGFGAMMEDPLGQTKVYKFRVSISHERSSIGMPSSAPVGVQTNLMRMITIDYRGGLLEGDLFTIAERNQTSRLEQVYDNGVMVTYDGEHVAHEVDTATAPITYKVGKIDALTEDGGIIGYQAPIIEPGV